MQHCIYNSLRIHWEFMDLQELVQGVPKLQVKEITSLWLVTVHWPTLHPDQLGRLTQNCTCMFVAQTVSILTEPLRNKNEPCASSPINSLPKLLPVDPHLCAKGLNHIPFKSLLKQVAPVRCEDDLLYGLKNCYVWCWQCYCFHEIELIEKRASQFHKCWNAKRNVSVLEPYRL